MKHICSPVLSRLRLGAEYPQTGRQCTVNDHHFRSCPKSSIEMVEQYNIPTQCFGRAVQMACGNEFNAVPVILFFCACPHLSTDRNGMISPHLHFLQSSFTHTVLLK